MQARLHLRVRVSRPELARARADAHAHVQLARRHHPAGPAQILERRAQALQAAATPLPKRATVPGARMRTAAPSDGAGPPVQFKLGPRRRQRSSPPVGRGQQPQTQSGRPGTSVAELTLQRPRHVPRTQVRRGQPEQSPMQAGGRWEPFSHVGPGDAQVYVVPRPKSHCAREKGKPVRIGLLSAGRGGAHFFPHTKLDPTSGPLHSYFLNQAHSCVMASHQSA